MDLSRKDFDFKGLLDSHCLREAGAGGSNPLTPTNNFNDLDDRRTVDTGPSEPATIKRHGMILKRNCLFLAIPFILTASASFSADLRVIDGDTIHIGGENIRILDLDTPEMRGKCDAERRLARLAKKRLQTLLNAPYRVERRGKGYYGRTLAHVWVNGEKVSDVLIREGYGRPYAGGRKPWCD